MSGVAVVTGASSGIGVEFARQLAARGYDLLLVARRQDRLETVAAEIRETHHRKVEVLPLDLAANGAAATVRARAELLGDVNVLVNNAGYGTYGHFLEQDDARELGQIRLNCESLVALTRAVVPKMAERKKGVVVNVASLAAFQPVPYMTTYAATKAFVLSFTEALAEEMRPLGVHVSALCPGPVDTEFFQVASPTRTMRHGPMLQPDAVVRMALDAAFDGRVIRIPGAISKILAFGATVAPRALARKVAGLTVKPQ